MLDEWFWTQHDVESSDIWCGYVWFNHGILASWPIELQKSCQQKEALKSFVSPASLQVFYEAK